LTPVTACGLDFGTSNTTLGHVAGAGIPALLPLEGAHTTVPSAIFFHRDSRAQIGRAAMAAYVEGEGGRLMRSLKSVLGSPLLHETTAIGRSRITFQGVIARYLGAVKARAEAALGAPLGSVVHGRPVHFVDGDPQGDRDAEAALAAIAREVGFSEVSFQFEPIAAALDYERQIDHEEIALIADIGGGTSDFSIVRISPDRARQAERGGDILANDGVRIGGVDFDRQLSLGSVMPLLGYRSAMKRPDLDVPSSYFHDLATWSSINRLYDRRVRRELEEVRRDAAEPALIDRLVTVVDQERGHTLAMDVEGAKIGLSDAERLAFGLDWVEPGLAVDLGREDLVQQTERLAERIAGRVENCLAQAGLRPDGVDALFLTGGSTQLAHVRAAIAACLPRARVVEGDTFGSVGTGLAIEAAHRYGG
jgi:hypothetical chaperone protein